MKVTGLEGDYCPSCAGVLEGHLKDHQKIIVMCGSVCHATLQQTGDYERLHAPKETATVKHKRGEERDPGETEQHAAEKAGYVKK